MLVKTTSLKQDDRVRKEALSLQRLRGAEVIILALLQDNSKAKGLTEYGIYYESIQLISRLYFKKAGGLIIKTIEMYIHMLKRVMLARPQVIWVHDVEFLFILPFIRFLGSVLGGPKIVIDLHEMPYESLLRKKIGKMFIKWNLNQADSIISAEVNRQRYLEDIGAIDSRMLKKCFILENYADLSFFEMAKQDLPFEVKEWLSGVGYLLAQGGGGPDRCFEQQIEAIMTLDEYKMIVIGGFDIKVIDKLMKKYGKSDLEDKIYFTGNIPQFEIIKYIDNCEASMIFYEYNEHSLNTKFCAPNRFYQAISRGKPVICGNNPPMKNIVEKYGIGYVCDSDGKNVNSILAAIQEFRKLQVNFSHNASTCQEIFVWENQESEILNIL